MTLTEVDVGCLSSIAPFKGQTKPVAAALKDVLGVGFPGVGRVLSKGGVAIQWFGQGQAMLRGVAPPDLAGRAAVTDQTDAWAVVRLDGAGAEDVLARLVPVDLRSATFRTGHTLRSTVGHMMAAITRVGATGFEVMVFRSMAGTLVHELTVAMQGVSARK
jgi:sarcosine oxidase subunit gamma